MNNGHSRWGNRIIIVSLLLVVAALASQVVTAYFIEQTAVMHLGTHRFDIRIADTERTRAQGLSGTSELASNEAMVFVFDTNSRWGIWMKDMNYAIDVVWLDESKHVIDYVTSISPDSYPRRFVPKEDARYVVELKSGTVQQKNLRIGDQAVFSGTSRKL
jgi:uncharacterized membrane protein (UPF0127 family)